MPPVNQNPTDYCFVERGHGDITADVVNDQELGTVLWVQTSVDGCYVRPERIGEFAAGMRAAVAVQPTESDRLSPQREAEIAARADAAYLGPWRRSDDEGSLERYVISEDDVFAVSLGYRGNNTQAEAEFIAHAREDVPALLAELAAVRKERDEARAAALRAGAEAVLQSSHGEPMRDAYNAKMQAVGLLRRMAAGKPEEPVTPAESATEYGIRIPGGRVLLDGNTKDRGDQVQRLARCQGKALWPDAVLVQRSVSYGEWTESTS